MKRANLFCSTLFSKYNYDDYFSGSAEQADFWRKLVVTLAKKSNSFSIEVSILFKMPLFDITAIFAIS